MTHRSILAALLLALACDRPVEIGAGYRLVADAPTDPVRALDVLFVVDNSGAMAEEQERLASSVSRFTAALDERMSGRPDLHVGVTSTNVGTGPDGGGGDACSGDGDDGHLLVPDACPALDRPFLIDLADPDDADAPRTINYPEGQLADTLACMTRLGTTGCGFEQQLEAMRRALDGSNPESDGFVRRDAMLLVVLVTDEDDCSAFDRQIYDGSVDDRDEPLGELSSFRCFEFGVVCDQPDARSVGERTGCVPRRDSAYLRDPVIFAEFLRDLKGGPGMVMLAAFAAAPSPVEVFEWPDSRELMLRPLCDETVFQSGGLPAVRIHSVLDSLPRAFSASMCESDLAADLSRLGEAAGSAMLGASCLWATPFDSDDDRAGIQPVCRAELRLDSGEWIDLPACDQDAGAESCFEVREDRAACGWTESRLAVAVDGLTLPGERVRVECLEARDPGQTDHE